MLNYRPRSWIAVSVLTFLGACFVSFIAYASFWVSCCSEAGYEATWWNRAPLAVALMGIFPAVYAIVLSVDDRGRPWRWCSVTVILYASSIAVVLAAAAISSAL